MKKALSNTFNFAVNAAAAVGGSYLLFQAVPLFEAVVPAAKAILATPFTETATAFKNAVMGNQTHALEAVAGGALVYGGVKNTVSNVVSSIGNRFASVFSRKPA